MTDIVERLRELAAVDNCQASIEAADEIERLREELDIWKSVFPDIALEQVQPDRVLLENKIKELEKEVKDLKDRNTELGWIAYPDRMGQ